MTRCLLRPHRWEPRTVNHNEIFSDLSNRDMPTRRETEVLYVCAECGKPRVKTLRGTWTLKDVKR